MAKAHGSLTSLATLAAIAALALAFSLLIMACGVQHAMADDATQTAPDGALETGESEPDLVAGTTDADDTAGATEADAGDEQAETAPSLTYATHRQGKSWGKPVRAPKVAGFASSASTIDAFSMTLDTGTHEGGIAYRSHLAKGGWQAWKASGEPSGKLSRSAKLDSVKIKLTGELSQTHYIVYRVNVESVGWLPWTCSGNKAGYANGARIKAIQAKLVERPEPPAVKRTIDNGIYTIVPTTALSFCAGIPSESTKAKTDVRIEPSESGRLAQIWKVTWKGNGYEIANGNSGLVLDAPRATANPCAIVKQAKRSSSATQRWAIEKTAGGYHIVAASTGTQLTAQKASLKKGCGLALALPDSRLPHVFKMKQTSALRSGTLRLFSKLNRTKLCASVSDGSPQGGAQATLGKARDKLDERLVATKDGDSFRLQVPNSGKYLACKGNLIVAQSRKSTRAQRWRVTIADTGGVQLVNEASGKAIAVKGGKGKAGAGIALAKPSDASAQSWFPRQAQLVPAGLYELSARRASNLRLGVAGGALSSGTNAAIYRSNGANSQKFAITPAKNGCLRIGMAFGRTALTAEGSSTQAGTNVRMETWRASASQLWKPTVTDSGLAFVNKRSGKLLAFSATRSGANVRLASAKAPARFASWSLWETKSNGADEDSFRNAIIAAPGGSLKLANASGYKISKARLNQLNGALRDCWAHNAGIGFVMCDLGTGMTISMNPDWVRFGASTIKGLYVTYLFEEYLERGRLSWNDIGSLAWPTIVYSNNDAYRALRARFGNEAEFGRWLASAGVGYIGTWGDYSARTLAKAWTHMAGYLSSGGRYVGTWKSLFSRSDHSFIREALSGAHPTYTKPGWMEVGTWSGTIMNDAGIVSAHGGRYLLAFVTTVEPNQHRYLVANVVKALDAIHAEMPRNRAR